MLAVEWKRKDLDLYGPQVAREGNHGAILHLLGNLKE